MNVVLSGIYYPVAILRYFEAALNRLKVADENVRVVCMGPYTGNWIPWNGGMSLPEHYGTVPDIPLDRTLVSNGSLPFRIAENQLSALYPDFVPDIWLQVDAGFHFAGRPRKGLNFIVGTDPHCLNYAAQRSWADKFFCMQTPYMAPLDEWLPYAYDPVWHVPLADVEKTYDAGLVGAPYDDRRKLIDALKAKGFSVLATGYGPSYEDARKLWAQCKIGLNWSTRQDLCARVFEMMAIGLCPVVNHVPDLKSMGFVEGSDYIGFSTLDEAVQSVENLLKTGTWQRIAEYASRAVAGHTWDARLRKVLSYAGSAN